MHEPSQRRHPVDVIAHRLQRRYAPLHRHRDAGAEHVKRAVGRRVGLIKDVPEELLGVLGCDA
jgi:hypothetical protein